MINWRTCPVCQEEFKNSDNRNINRKNLTCGERCHDAQRAQRQQERRFRKRQERLQKAAVQLVKARKLKKGSVKRWIAQQTNLKLAHAGVGRRQEAA